MRQRLLALVIAAAAACGGKAKPIEHPPLPDDKPPVAEAKPAESEEPKEPAEPPMPKGPLAVMIPVPKVEVKLVNAGKGKKAKLALSPKAGAKQTTELMLELILLQDGPVELSPDTGGKINQTYPTAVLTAEAETQDVDDEGKSTFRFTVSGVDAKDRAGQVFPSADFKMLLGTLVGATLSGTVDANGMASDFKLTVPNPLRETVDAVEFMHLALLPMWPALPSEAIGPGAKWTVTSTQKVAGQIDVTKVVTYELVGKKGTASTIKGTTKLSGTNQEVATKEGKATLGNIGGAGTSEIVVNDGVLVPQHKQKVETLFSIVVQPTKPAGAATEPKPIEVKVRIDQNNASTPKT
jgi:hypothetical protein